MKTFEKLLSADSATFGDAAVLNELVFDEIALETNLKSLTHIILPNLPLAIVWIMLIQQPFWK